MVRAMQSRVTFKDAYVKVAIDITRHQPPHHKPCVGIDPSYGESVRVCLDEGTQGALL